MAGLIDTAILLRLANTSDAQHPIAQSAVLHFHARGEVLYVAPQNLIEFRNAATRPVADNGLGYGLAVVDQKIAAIESYFPLLPETPDLYPAWKSLVQQAGVIGKQVHDARLAAICKVYGVANILTFNIKHFARFVPFIPGFTVVDPRSL